MSLLDIPTETPSDDHTASGTTRVPSRETSLSARLGPAAPLIGVAAGVTVWWLITSILAAPDSMLREFAPLPTLDALVVLAGEGEVWADATSSVWRLVAGLGLASIVGVTCGAVIGARAIVESGSRPAVMFLRMVSPLSWAPVAIGLLGLGDLPVIALVAAASVWPILLSTAEGVRSVNRDHLRVARGLGATRWEVVRSIVAPSARPYVLAGVRQSLGTAWIVIVPAEMLGVTSGLGYAILNARDQLQYSHITALILIIGAIGYAIDAQARWLLRTRRERLSERYANRKARS